MSENQAVGYKALIDRFNLSVIKHYRQSYITPHGRSSEQIHNNRETHIYQKTYALKDPGNVFEQLEFAVKYDGINLEILNAVFNKLPERDVEKFVAENLSSKYMRIIWFLYEFLTDKILDTPDLKRLKYVDILDRDKYFSTNGVRSPRHRVINNLIGTKDFCPIVRKTKMIEMHMANKYDEKAKSLADKYDPQLIARASHYLFTKETLSSYEIEHERPNKNRIDRFVRILQKSSSIPQLDKDQLIELQNVIVDPRFKDTDYRNSQNYVGENVFYEQKIHYISPKPQDVRPLMQGLLYSLKNARESEIHPVVIAAMISFGFVFIHPFEDGNGRIHRFFIHYILSKQKFTPSGIIFPVSAVMLKKIHEYDHVLETFSKPLMNVVEDYNLSSEGILNVNQNSDTYYKFIDYTYFAEYLFACIEETLREHFEHEIEFLVKYDSARFQMRSIVDMPDRLIDLFIKFVMQNHGELGKQKRLNYFNMLTDEEIHSLKMIVRTTIMSL